MIKELTQKATDLLKNLIEKQSFSGEEEETAAMIQKWFEERSIPFQHSDNNIWAVNQYFDEKKPTLLLNSHHDTVKPNRAYTRDPLKAEITEGKLYGLGSNDAGGSLVSLLAAFTYFYDKKDLKYNLLMLASAEEENSGAKGIRSVLPKLPQVDFAVVGEPTSMQMAVAEKGLLVLDCYAKGKTGHAAHGTGKNAIYLALEAISWFKNYKFPEVSETLGEVKMTVTQIDAGKQHNVIPSVCHFVVDVRTTDRYSNKEVLDIIKKNAGVEVKERSLRHNSSSISTDHPIVRAGKKLGIKTFGSPTMSDQTALDCPSLKLGPGDTLRSHSADEFIYLTEVEEGIKTYIKLLEKVVE
ncbi:MAG: acetylornithine deacetylase [Flavobacteriia bacterium]|nr:MAG: acetylornithine deacetylase [Flavobacteriia bacterium]